MINFAELQENVTSCLENQKIMSAQLLKLEQAKAAASAAAAAGTSGSRGGVSDRAGAIGSGPKLTLAQEMAQALARFRADCLSCAKPTRSQ